MYNVFISYRRDGGYELARLVYEHMHAAGLNPFFDLEELRSGPFNTRLYSAIEECDNFVLVLPKGALERCSIEGDWLLLEIEHAIKHGKNIVPLMMNGFEWPDTLPKSIKNLPNYNGVQLSREYFDASLQKLMSMMQNVNIVPTETLAPSSRDTENERRENTYFSFSDKKELRRLKIQQDLLKQFDEDVYARCLSEYDEIAVLDVGSNNGDFVMDRLGKDPRVKKIIGLEVDEAVVEVANGRYAREGEIAFFPCNVEGDDLVPLLDRITEGYGIDGFDILNISMLILHLKSPYKLLKTLRKYLKKGGSVIIKDIDDGLNLAYPDEGKKFARAVEICARNDTAGYRHSGRQIYTLLKRSGYRDIRLEKNGLSTINMDFEERSALFDTYFSFILEDLKIMRERYPDDARIKKDLEWYDEAYEDMEEQFQDDAFYFTLGFVMFTAKR